MITSPFFLFLLILGVFLLAVLLLLKRDRTRLLKRGRDSSRSREERAVHRGLTQVNVSKAERKAFREGFKSARKLIKGKRYKEAFLGLNQLAGNVPDDDASAFAGTVAGCFYSMCDGMPPLQVLDTFDSMKRQGESLAFAEKNEQAYDTLVLAFADSLLNYPDIQDKSQLKEVISFTRHDHKLARDLRRISPQNFAGLLDFQAHLTLEGWELNENGDDLDAMISQVQKRL